MKIHTKLLLALLAGILFGAVAHDYTHVTWLGQLNEHFLHPVGQIFLRLIFMVVVPLVVSALILGVYELGRGRGLGNIARKTLFYTLIASTASVVIGITLVNVIRPGSHFQIDKSIVESQTSSLKTITDNAAKAKTVSQSLVELVTRNPLDSALKALDGEMLALMIFSLLFGVGLVMASKENDETTLIKVLDQIFGASMKVVELAMRLAPIAVFCIVFNTGFKNGIGIFGSLAFYVGVVVVGLLLQQFVVYSVLLRTFGGRNPFEFFRQCREVYLYAFSTASSNATLPKSLHTAQHILKLPADASRFVLTIGATANQNGTALFEGVTVLFLAQVYGIDLTYAQQFEVVLMSILAGVGTAGVPGGSLPLILILLQSVGIPGEGMALILGVDRFLDMCRTTLNVSGDLVIAALVSPKPKSA